MDLQLAGKSAVVTGGSRGIGKAVARALATEGCDVVIAARGREALEAAAAELSTSTGRAVVAVATDTSSAESVQVMVEASVDALGGVDILVNSAAQPMGQSRPPTLAEITDDLF